jgi:membrane protease YdiL (CAAX protease family)
MASSNPSPNGDPAVPDSFEMYLEPVDPSELTIDPIPTVEAVADMSRPGFGFWKAFLWCIAFLLLTQFIPAVVIVLAVTLAKGPAASDFLEEVLRTAAADSTNKILVSALPVCGLIFTVTVLRFKIGRNWPRQLAVRIPHFEHVVLVLLLILPFLVFNITLQAALQFILDRLHIRGLPDLEGVMKAMAGWPWWILVFAMSVGPALSEELFCRGFLGQGLVSRRGLTAGILATSVLFGLIHVIPLQAIAAAVMGVALHYLYVSARSLLIPMLLHFLNNALAMLTESGDVLIGKSLEHALDHRPALFLAAAVLLASVVGLAFYQTRVRILTPHGTEAPRALYPHVEVPPATSANRAIAGPLPVATVGLLVLASGFFAAIWFGLG